MSYNSKYTGEQVEALLDIVAEGGEKTTEAEILAMGFTKNTGTYSKPSTGIPKSDLESAVQTSLDKADTALQSYTEQYKGTVEAVDTNESVEDPELEYATTQYVDGQIASAIILTINASY